MSRKLGIRPWKPCYRNSALTHHGAATMAKTEGENEDRYVESIVRIFNLILNLEKVITK